MVFVTLMFGPKSTVGLLAVVQFVA